MKKVLAIINDSGPCGKWRIVKPIECPMPNPRVQMEIYIPDTRFRPSEYDGFLIQRPEDQARLNFIRECKKTGRKVIIDFDDRFPIVDPDHQCVATHGEGSEIWNIMRECIPLADGLIVSTPQLEAYYRPLNPRIAVVMNAIDLRSPIYQQPQPRPANRRDKTVMFWSGQVFGHVPNLRMIKSAVEQAIAQMPNLCFAMCGPRALLKIFSLPSDRFFHIKPAAFDQFMRIPSVADFSLAPLRLDPFNDCKSEIRILESAAWGVPCIASNAAPYQRFYERSDGACLLSEANDHEAWLNHILRMAGDAPYRREFGARARKAVELQYDLQTENLKRESFITSLWS